MKFVIEFNGHSGIVDGMKPKLGCLWLHLEFRKLWSGQVASLLGAQFVIIVLPLTAVVILDATPIQMGIIGAMSGVPALIGLFLGVWTDRRRRGQILIAVDVGRMLLLLSIPGAHILGLLSIELLYVIVLGISAMTMLFEIAYRSFLPSVVARNQLVEVNAKLELANSGAVAIGPGISGLIAHAVTAPFALFFGAAMFAVSAVMFKSLRVNESDSITTTQGLYRDQSMLVQLRDGFGFFRKNKILVGIAAAGTSLVFFGSAYDAILIL